MFGWFLFGLFCQLKYNKVKKVNVKLVYFRALFNPEVFCKVKVG